MTITPGPPVPHDVAPVDRPRPRVSYNWGSIVLGEWQPWIGHLDRDTDTMIPVTVDDDDQALRDCTRVRIAAKWHADRHGLRLESRRTHKGRVLLLRFTPREV